jgi:hypothetical protein
MFEHAKKDLSFYHHKHQSALNLPLNKGIGHQTYEGSPPHGIHTNSRQYAQLSESLPTYSTRELGYNEQS